MKFFSPVCVLVCLANSSERAKRLPHPNHEQGKGRSPKTQIALIDKKTVKRMTQVEQNIRKNDYEIFGKTLPFLCRFCCKSSRAEFHDPNYTRHCAPTTLFMRETISRILVALALKFARLLQTLQFGIKCVKNRFSILNELKLC